MDSLEFIMIVVAFAVVIGWYLKNAEAGSPGLLGLLALVDDPEITKGGATKSYRLKKRLADKCRGLRDSRVPGLEATTYTPLDQEGAAQRRFRRQDESRYRSKDQSQ